AQDQRWANGPGFFWAAVGGRIFATAAGVERRHERQREHADRNRASRMTFGIRAKDGTPLGDMAFNWILPHHRIAMLGAMIGEPEYWGGGYGTDALLLLVDFAFDWLDMRKLWLFTMSLNQRVAGQMEKVGFTLEARQREAYWTDGAPSDALAYGLLREDWPGRIAMIERLGLTAK
ncbi:MAG: GNAT family N-acetyltransferase, partial [Anaerolineae bacterium]|nr:GNAT family N-acetyltransferase [Anaerolineae bacterium]